MRHLDKDTVLNKINLTVDITKETPREILERHNPSIGSIPILGGWGYTQDDCVIINKNDSSVNQSMPFFGVELEYLFAKLRIYEELIFFREPGQQCNAFEWEFLEQKTIFKDNRTFDHLHFLVKGHTDKDWEYLQKILEENNKFEDDYMGLRNYLKESEELLFCYETDYWFDITSFYLSSFSRKSISK
tara:strand:+ start:440 stop:1003 length:564 start_codon:yes stop_codon:yes gene_type:complete